MKGPVWKDRSLRSFTGGRSARAGREAADPIDGGGAAGGLAGAARELGEGGLEVADELALAAEVRVGALTEEAGEGVDELVGALLVVLLVVEGGGLGEGGGLVDEEVAAAFDLKAPSP